MILNSKYPIICSGMNGVSDLKLALACAKAGITPSFVPYSHSSFSSFFTDYNEYKKQTDVIPFVCLGIKELLHDKLYHNWLPRGIDLVEIIESNNLDNQTKDMINELRDIGMFISLKILATNEIEEYIDVIDMVTIKGPEGAGRGNENINLLDETKRLRRKYPGLKIIASGGIKDKNDIENLIKSGADAVSIGTMFALSEESSIPSDVKLKIIKTKSLSRLTKGAMNKGIIFDQIETDDFNNTKSNNIGISTGKSGHVNMGESVKYISVIETVETIVSKLCKEKNE